MSWPEWFFWKINSPILGMLLMVITSILTVYGVSLVRYAYMHRWEIVDDPYPEWRWSRPRWIKRVIDAWLRFYTRWARRWVPPTFEFNLGSFMTADAMLYALLAITVLQSPDDTDLWVAILFTAIAVPGVRSFFHWARDHLPRRGS